MHISSLHIQNFKGFKTFDLPLREGLNIIVGNNEARKSTVLEAINLVLTGFIDGKYLTRENLNQFLFNTEVVEDYLQKITTGQIVDPPKILIELFFSEDASEDFQGSNNNTSSEAKGIYLSIGLKEELASNYRQLLANTDPQLSSLPLELYDIELVQFSGTHQTRLTLPMKSILIDNTSNFQNVSDVMIAGIIKSKLEEEEKLEAAQFYRTFKDRFKTQPIHAKLSSLITYKETTVSIDPSAKNSWDTHLTVYFNNIPFTYIGKGRQTILKTHVALSSKRAQESKIVLIEEPENHLSHATLHQLMSEIETHLEDRQVIITSHSSFVANKLGLESLILLSENGHVPFDGLKEGTQDFFQKLPGYNTLRLVLAERAILVEGDADELIVQRAYLDTFGALPIQHGIDVISVNNTYDRFFQIAKPLNKKIALLVDVDDKKENRDELKEQLKETPNIQVFFEKNDKYAEIEDYNNNTLEPLLLKYNSLKTFNEIFKVDKQTDEDMLRHMKANKTTCALKIFESANKITYPDYIKDAIKFVASHGKQK